MNEPRYKPNYPSAWVSFNAAGNESKPEELSRIGRRDWDKIIGEIEQHMTLRAIAHAMHRSSPTLIAWKISGEPKDSDARRLLALHAKYCVGPR